MILIAQRVVDALAKSRCSGWDRFDLDFRDGRGQFIEGFHGLVVLGRCGPVDFEGGEDVPNLPDRWREASTSISIPGTAATSSYPIKGPPAVNRSSHVP